MRIGTIVVGVAMLFACKREADVATPPATAQTAPAHVPTRTPRAIRGRPPRESAFYATSFAKRPSVAELTSLGESLFADPALSASGTLACATCHDPRHAYAPADDAAVALGGTHGDRAGGRAVPSLRYLEAVPPFSEHFHEGDGDDGVDQGPAGGLTWDGRAPSVHDQARLPLYSPLEMANASRADLVTRIRHAPYAPRFDELFGAGTLADDALAEKATLLALEVVQQRAADFYPFDSKYDAYLRGTVQLSAQEARGHALFDDPHKGDCARCHPSAMGETGFPAFTDYGFVALGVPRNRELVANRDPAYFDLGLCGPLRRDLAAHPEYCGMFRTPSLRNVATRRRFFHNGSFTSLADVVRFYATRDTTPERWYGRAAVPDDLPASARVNVDHDAPFGRPRGGTPALSEPEIADLVAFLGTLTDGYRP